MTVTDYTLHQPVYIAVDHNDDEQDHVLGYFAGWGTMVGERYGRDRNSMYSVALVNLSLNAQGWFQPEDQRIPGTYISTVAVHPENLTPAPWYVNIYEVDRVYGGPEEGGWWYDAGTLVKSERFDTELEAERAADKLRDEYPATGESSSVIYSGGDYSIRIENEPGEHYPKHRPHYE